jgi:deoxyribose-phosphate aldolase
MAGRITALIDHTNLKPEATAAAIRRLCQEARDNGCYSVCVNSCYVGLCHALLLGSPVKVCSVVGFPLGAMATPSKAAETAQAVADGADEIDMVINVGALKEQNIDYVRQDIQAVVEAAGSAPVKVILETCLLDDAEKVAACQVAEAAGAAFVKTSTGFSTDGATVEDIALMRRTVGTRLGVKASGGIRDLAAARRMVEAGASRIGASASVQIAQAEAAEADEAADTAKSAGAAGKT